MTDAMHSSTSTFDRTYVPWGLAALLGAAVVIVVGNTNIQPGENGGTGPLLISLLVCAVVAALLYGRLVPGSTNPTRTGLIFGILAVATLLAFWSGLPVVLGPAAVALSRRAGGSKSAKTALVLGALATVIGFIGGILASL